MHAERFAVIFKTPTRRKIRNRDHDLCVTAIDLEKGLALDENLGPLYLEIDSLSYEKYLSSAQFGEIKAPDIQQTYREVALRVLESELPKETLGQFYDHIHDILKAEKAIDSSPSTINRYVRRMEEVDSFFRSRKNLKKT